jgi:hypothetical protein
VIPPTFGPEFLEWFREATEERWRTHIPRTAWQVGTRWRSGLTNAQIEAAERRFGLQFPPDYRLFLATLNTPDRPMLDARYEGEIGSTKLVPWLRDGHTDWTGDAETIERALEWPIEGLLWSIEADKSWHPLWGPRPETQGERAAVVRGLAQAGAQLIPVGGNCYLAGPGDRGGNPVMSMHGADVIEHGRDLRSYLLVDHKLVPWSNELTDSDEPIPFWEDVINDGLPLSYGR